MAFLILGLRLFKEINERRYRWEILCCRQNWASKKLGNLPAHPDIGPSAKLLKQKLSDLLGGIFPPTTCQKYIVWALKWTFFGENWINTPK
jgi:hypothetical protein